MKKTKIKFTSFGAKFFLHLLKIAPNPICPILCTPICTLALPCSKHCIQRLFLQFIIHIFQFNLTEKGRDKRKRVTKLTTKWRCQKM